MDKQPLVEALSARELEILSLMANGLTNQQIADRLFLEETTIRWYLRQVYGKLGIETPGKKRQAAIVRAQELGLLDAALVALPRHNLPAQTTEFVGRETELAELADLLENPKIRLLTVLAPGGMGKSRLALECARKFLLADASEFANGLFFVPLAPIREAEHIVSAIAHITGFQLVLYQTDK